MSAKIWRRLSTYDLYERHEVTQRLLTQRFSGRSSVSVLDVGGRRGLLSQYMPNWVHVTTLNPDRTGHVTGEGLTLPFGENTFDAVITLDTLEHMPRQARRMFLYECLRAARECLLTAAPFGSAEHIERERILNEKFFVAHGVYHEYLNEHVLYGLPLPVEIDSFACLGSRTAHYYAGDYRWQADAFERTLRTVQMPRLGALPINLFERVASSALMHPIRLRQESYSNANRFYLVIEK